MRVRFLCALSAVSVAACSGSVMPSGDASDADAQRSADVIEFEDIAVFADRTMVDMPSVERDVPTQVDVQLGDVPFPNAPPPEMTPQLMPVRCMYPANTTGVFNDRVELSRSPGTAPHLLRWDRTIRALPTAWVASWMDNSQALHDARIGVRGGTTDNNSFTNPMIPATAAVLGRMNVPAGAQMVGPVAVNPRRAFVESGLMPGIGLTLDGPMDRIFGVGDYLGQIAWFPTIREFIGVERAMTYGALRIDRLAPNGRTLIAGPELGIGIETLKPQVFFGDNSVWVGFLDHTDYPDTIVVAPLDRNTAAYRGRMSVADAGGSCFAAGGYEAIAAIDLPVSVESCQSKGIRLTIFGEFIRPDPPTPTTRTWVRDRDPVASATLRARVAFNGAEIAVVWKESNENGLSFRIYNFRGQPLTPRLTVESPEPALEATFDVAANPAENGAWAILWSTNRATYLARMGRCGTNMPGEG